jgi:hypothetical protein
MSIAMGFKSVIRAFDLAFYIRHLFTVIIMAFEHYSFALPLAYLLHVMVNYSLAFMEY